MKTETHYLYAKFLGERFQSTKQKELFLFGCVEPDYNMFSYFKGFSIRPFFGHNWDNCKSYINRETELLIHNKLTANNDYFKLGKLVHYICDAFTYTHNCAFIGNLYEHYSYEQLLHKVFLQFINGSNKIAYPTTDKFRRINDFHKDYVGFPFSAERDVQYITSVVNWVLKNCYNY